MIGYQMERYTNLPGRVILRAALLPLLALFLLLGCGETVVVVLTPTPVPTTPTPWPTVYVPARHGPSPTPLPTISSDAIAPTIFTVQRQLEDAGFNIYNSDRDGFLGDLGDSLIVGALADNGRLIHLWLGVWIERDSAAEYVLASLILAGIFDIDASRLSETLGEAMGDLRVSRRTTTGWITFEHMQVKLEVSEGWDMFVTWFKP